MSQDVVKRLENDFRTLTKSDEIHYNMIHPLGRTAYVMEKDEVCHKTTLTRRFNGSEFDFYWQNPGERSRASATGPVSTLKHVVYFPKNPLASVNMQINGDTSNERIDDVWQSIEATADIFNSLYLDIYKPASENFGKMSSFMLDKDKNLTEKFDRRSDSYRIVVQDDSVLVRKKNASCKGNRVDYLEMILTYGESVKNEFSRIKIMDKHGEQDSKNLECVLHHFLSDIKPVVPRD